MEDSIGDDIGSGGKDDEGFSEDEDFPEEPETGDGEGGGGGLRGLRGGGGGGGSKENVAEIGGGIRCQDVVILWARNGWVERRSWVFQNREGRLGVRYLGLVWKGDDEFVLLS